MIECVFTEEELSGARKVGLARYEKARQLGRSQPYGDPGDDKRTFIDCFSALAEYAVARYLDLPWHSEIVDDLTVKPPDVGSRIEVRWTDHPHGHLLGKDNDPDGWIMVLVVGKLEGMRMVGWTASETVKQERYQSHPKARSPSDYWFPQKELLMMELLLQMRNNL